MTPRDRSILTKVHRRVKEALPAGEVLVPEPFITPNYSDVWVQITSTSQTDGRYPGTVYRRNVDATFTLLGEAGDSWVDTPNGESLTTGVYYRAVAVGIRVADNKAIFDTITSGANAFIRGKLDAQLSYQGSATLSIWWYNGSAEADTTENVTVYDWLLSSGQTIASGKQVTAAWDARSGRYYVTGAQCA